MLAIRGGASRIPKSILRPANWSRALHNTQPPDLRDAPEDQGLSQEDLSFSPKPDPASEKQEWAELVETARQEAAKAPRPLPSQKNRTELKEEMYFRDIFHSILDPNEKPAFERVLQVFEREKSEGSDDMLNSILEARKPTHKQTTGREPLSVQLGIGGLVEHPDVLQKTEKVQKFLGPVLSHINKDIPSNQGVSDYFENVVLPRFNPQQISSWDSLPSTVEEPLVCPETISTLLAACIKSLRVDFHDPMGAINLFERAKRHSVEVFASACTADAYNEIMQVRWKNYRDLYAVLNLAAEIAINAIRPNVETIRILSTVHREATDNSRKITSAESLPLWTKEDVPRLRELNRYRSRFQQAWSGHMPLLF